MSSPVITPIALDDLSQLSRSASHVIERLRERVFAPERRKQLELRFNVRSASEMVGRTEKAIRTAEADGRLPEPEKDPDTGRRNGYSLSDINQMREVFGTLPHRAPEDPPLILAIQNFKGGVGKSTVVTHLAQYFALKGYRVCVIDCDSQASTTAIFGLNPDVNIDRRGRHALPLFPPWRAENTALCPARDLLAGNCDHSRKSWAL